jgi:predicted small integral membrane protein
MTVRRIFKTLLVGAVALDLTLAAVGNLTDYETNYAFVRNVLAMDTIFKDSTLRWRALTDPFWARAFYACIIAWEVVAAVLSWAGFFLMARGGTRWEKGKTWAEAGLGAALLLWLLAFLVVGGEWFAMWQSGTWNGTDAAFRMFAVYGIVLLYLTRPDSDGRAGSSPYETGR